MAPANIVRESGLPPDPTFVFLSELIGRTVASPEGPIGRLADLKIALGDPFPRAAALVLRRRRKKQLYELDWSDVEYCADRTITLKPGAAGRLRPLEVGRDELLLRDDLLDKQVVDTLGARIERVNDVHLLIVKRDLRVVHVDFGARGLLRRLGWLKSIDRATAWLFAYQIEERMISWKFIQPLLADPVKGSLKLNVTARKIHELHPSDLADIIEELDSVNRSSLFRSLDLQTAALTLEEVDDPKLQASLIDTAPAERASDILEEMAPDEATDMLADMPEEKQRRLIGTMDAPSRRAVLDLLRFKEGTAGSIMTKDFFAVGRGTTVEQAIGEFRKLTCPLESVAYIYVNDPGGRLIGVCTLRHLLVADKDAALGALMNPHLITVEPDEKVDDVTSLFRKYKFLALPVVDGERILQGLITLKDILQEEIEE
ncbi:MAG: CBS domain-containing protein [Candidatus Aminicenantes bacterium]|nr:CBS domain-containing protein [Candidatus Aminicenantes bacterium]